jgi:hypothetical protein
LTWEFEGNLNIWKKSLDNINAGIKILNRGGEEMKAFSGNCPTCGRQMVITAYHCPECMVEVKGKFEAGGIGGLSQQQLDFVKTFLCCRGNIKEVEREMGISYPTVRNRLAAVIVAMGLTPMEEEQAAEERTGVLDRLEKGEIDAETAAKMLSGKRGR